MATQEVAQPARRRTRGAAGGQTPTPKEEPEEKTPTGGKQHRLGVFMGDATAQALREFMQARGVTATEAVRRAISLLDFVEKERTAGNRLAVVSGQGADREVREVIFGLD